jgi:hypothetical protein
VLRGTKIAALAVLWVAPLLLIFFGLRTNWRATWGAVGVHVDVLPFADLRSITGALVTLQNHGDPFTANPGDPWNRPLNYPRIWLKLFSMLGINNSRISLVGVAFCVFYLICVSALLVRCMHSLDALILLVAGLSFSPLTAIQLGNTDLFIFTLMFVGCMTHSKILKRGAFFAAAILKIYPLVAMPIVAVRGSRKERRDLLVLAALAAATFAWQWRDLNAIRHATPISSRAAYGVLSMKAQVEEGLDSPLGHRLPVSWIAILGCWLAGGGVVAAAWTNRTYLDESIRTSTNGGLFVAFGAIYAFTFAIGSNWDYRLIFLLPTLPLAFDLARQSTHRKWAIAYIALVILAENPLELISAIYGPALCQATTFFLFMIVTRFLTLQCKPVLANVSIGRA